MNQTQAILQEVAAERVRQDQKFGEQNHEPLYFLSILGEEFGEVSKEVCELRVDENRLDAAIASHQSNATISAAYARKRKRLEDLRTELIQTAAVCVNMLESLDRNELGSGR